MPPDGENALEIWLREFRENPHDYEINKKIGLCLSRIRKRQLHAEPYILRALSCNIKDADTKHLLQGMAHIYAIKGAFDSVVNVYKLAKSVCPEVPDFDYWLGDALFRVGRFDESSLILGAAIKSRLAAAAKNARARNSKVVHLLEPSMVICRFIGELASKIDTYLKARALGYFEASEAILLAPADNVSNMRLLDYWKDHITVISDPKKIDECLAVHGDDWLYLDYYTLPGGRSLHRYTAETAIQNQWEKEWLKPLLQLKEIDRERGRQKLREAGMPEGAWFVALHVREAGFHDEDEDWSFNKHRNAGIISYLPAIEEITSRGGFVIRLGDKTMKPLPKMAKVIDYALSDLYCDWMDIFLVAESRFYLGMASGPMSVAMAFGKPIAGTNWIHLGHWPYGKDDIFIHKTLRSAADGRVLSLAESLKPPFAGALEPLFFKSQGVIPVDNSAEEIRELTVEMLDRLEGQQTYSKEDERLQQAFKSSIRVFGIEPSSRAGMKFLKRYPELTANCPPIRGAKD